MKIAFSLAFVLVQSASSTFAASITFNASAPATDVYTSFTGVSTASSDISNVWRNWKSRTSTDYDQTTGTTFQVGASDIMADKISILVATRNSAVNNVPWKFILYHASQRDDAGGTHAGTSGTPTVDTVMAQFTTTVNVPATNSGGFSGYAYVTFDFDDVQLTAGEWYGFYGLVDGFNSTYGGGTTVSTTWKTAFAAGTTPGPNSNSSALRYADGGARDYILAQGSGTGYDGDIAFWVQGIEVPEPSCIVIIGLSFCFVGVLGAKRKKTTV